MSVRSLLDLPFQFTVNVADQKVWHGSPSFDIIDIIIASNLSNGFRSLREALRPLGFAGLPLRLFGFFGFPPRRLGEFLDHAGALELGDVVDEEHAVEMIDLVLQAGRQ